MEYFTGYLNNTHRFTDVLYRQDGDKMFYLSAHWGWHEVVHDHYITYFPIKIENFRNSIYPDEVINKLKFYQEVLE